MIIIIITLNIIIIIITVAAADGDIFISVTSSKATHTLFGGCERSWHVLTHRDETNDLFSCLCLFVYLFAALSVYTRRNELRWHLKFILKHPNFTLTAVLLYTQHYRHVSNSQS